VSRIFAKDAAGATTTATENLDRCQTDNYGLRWLAGNREGELTEDDLNLGKERLDMFDFVLIFEDLPAGVQKMCSELGWQCPVIEQRPHKVADTIPASVLADMSNRNRLDTALYQYAVAKAKAQGLFANQQSALRDTRAEQEGSLAGSTAVASEADQRWVC
jgi:hypothetical protein